MLLFELYHIKKEQEYLQQDIKKWKYRLADAKNWFEIEGKRDEDSKLFCQTVKDNMDSILYGRGINKIGVFIGSIDVNDCHKLMSNAESIFGELMDFVSASDSRIDEIIDHQIKQVYETIIFFLQALNGYIGGMFTKRFHWMHKISENTRQYQNKCMEFERYIQLSITPKSLIIEDLSCNQKSIFNDSDI